MPDDTTENATDSLKRMEQAIQAAKEARTSLENELESVKAEIKLLTDLQERIQALLNATLPLVSNETPIEQSDDSCSDAGTESVQPETVETNNVPYYGDSQYTIKHTGESTPNSSPQSSDAQPKNSNATGNETVEDSKSINSNLDNKNDEMGHSTSPTKKAFSKVQAAQKKPAKKPRRKTEPSWEEELPPADSEVLDLDSIDFGLPG